MPMDGLLQVVFESLAHAFSNVGEHLDAAQDAVNELAPGGEVLLEQLPPDLQKYISDLLKDACSAFKHLDEAIRYGGEELQSKLSETHGDALEALSAQLVALDQMSQQERQVLFEIGLPVDRIEKMVAAFANRIQRLANGEEEFVQLDEAISKGSQFICSAEEYLTGDTSVSDHLRRAGKVCKGASLVSADIAAIWLDFGTVTGMSVISGSADIAEGAGIDVPDEVRPAYWVAKGLRWTRKAGLSAATRIRAKWEVRPWRRR